MELCASLKTIVICAQLKWHQAHKFREGTDESRLEEARKHLQLAVLSLEQTETS